MTSGEGLSEMEQVLAYMNRISALGDHYHRSGNLLRYRKDILDHYLKTADIFLTMADGYRRTPSSGMVFAFSAQGYGLFSALSSLSERKGGLSEDLDARISLGLNESLQCIEQACEFLSKSVRDIDMNNPSGHPTLLRFRDQFLVFAPILKEVQPYVELIESCYHRLMADMIVRGAQSSSLNPRAARHYDNMLIGYFLELCSFREVDPMDPLAN